MKKILLILAVLLLVALMWCCVYKHHRLAIQDDVQKRAEQSLVDSGNTNVALRVDGRDVYLSAQGLSQDEQAALLEQVKNVYGVRVAYFEDAVKSASNQQEPTKKSVLPSSSLNVNYNGDALELTGRLHSEDEIQAVIAAIKKSFGKTISIDNQLSVGSEASDLDVLTDSISQLSKLNNGHLRADDKLLSLSGVAASDKVIDEVRADYQAYDSQYKDFDFSSDLELASTFTNDECQLRLNDLIKNEKIQFASAKSEITAASFPLLNRISKASLRCTASIEIYGHTDSQGNADFNIYLSQQRANAVKEYLVGKGIDQATIKVFGFGANQPIADNATRAGRAINRRIEFKVK